MNKLSTIILGKIYSYSDNCCVTGVNRASIYALAHCISKNPEQTQHIRVFSLIKVLRYCAMTDTINLWKLFVSLANKEIMLFKFVPKKYITATTSSLCQIDIDGRCSFCHCEDKEVFYSCNSIYIKSWESKAQYLTKNTFAIPDLVYNANEFIIDSYNQGVYEHYFKYPKSFRTYDSIVDIHNIAYVIDEISTSIFDGGADKSFEMSMYEAKSSHCVYGNFSEAKIPQRFYGERSACRIESIIDLVEKFAIGYDIADVYTLPQLEGKAISICPGKDKEILVLAQDEEKGPIVGIKENDEQFTLLFSHESIKKLFIDEAKDQQITESTIRSFLRSKKIVLYLPIEKKYIQIKVVNFGAIQNGYEYIIKKFNPELPINKIIPDENPSSDEVTDILELLRQQSLLEDCDCEDNTLDDFKSKPKSIIECLINL